MDITAGLIMGVVYAAAPGPVNVETLRQGMKGGFFNSLALQTGSSIGRIVYSLLALAGAGVLLQGATLQLVSGVVGMTVLFYLGITTIRDGHDLVVKSGDRTIGVPSARRAFWAGAILSLANPLAIFFWLSISSQVLHNSGMEGPTFLGGFFVGCIVTSVVVAFMASFWQSRLTARVALIISWSCGLAMILFGLKLGLSVGRQLIFW